MKKIVSLEELRSELLAKEPRDFVEAHIIQADCIHVTQQQIRIVRDTISKATGVPLESSDVQIVGSAKLGFGLFEKKRKDQSNLPAFREFSGESDIDIAFVSPTLFDAIWSELATYALAKPWMPHRMNKLGDYLVYGWIRPDHVPKEARLGTYDAWRDAIRKLTASTDFNRRKLSGALYRDIEFLVNYQSRGIAQCKANLESS